ncbi:hypothetical protein BGZ73_008736 [Actinomortierella ambigua]|nr:hypothetical protein BGZ73_008736 [Actinomortierella ambigua]
MAWASTTHKNGLEAPSLQHGPPQQAVSPRLSKNHEGLVHRSNHSSHGHHPDRYATGSPSLRGINGTNHSHSGQHLRQASAGNPIGHPSRSVSDHIVSPTASYAYPHSPVHGSIRRPHSARPMGESHSFASSAQEIGSHMASLPHAAGSQDYPIGHATRPSPYPPRRRTESVPSSPQFSHTRPDRSWAESYRHDVYAEKFPRHQRSNTTHGHVGDGMYESFSKVLSTTPSSELRDRPSFQPSANLAATPPLPPPAYDPRKAGDDPVAGHSAIRPSASEPDLERVHGGRPAVQTNGQADYWTKPSFDMHERMHSDRLPDPKGLAMPLRKDATHSRTQEDHLEQDEADGSVEGEGEEEGEDEEEGLDDDDGEDDDSVDRVPQQARHSWALQDYDDTQARMHHPLNHEAYRYGDDPYGNPQAHSLYGDNQHSSDVDGQSSGSHPPLYAPHPYQPLQQYLLRPQRISKSPKEKPLQPKNSQRGPYLTRQRVLASGMEPGKGTACRYVCSYCQKRFSRPSSLRIHTYSHTGERPFKCTEKGCERQFSVQSNMRRHLRVHRMDKIKFLDPIYPSQIASERPLQSRPQQQQQQPPLSQSQPPQPPHTSPVDHRMAPPLPLIGTTPIRS